MTPKPIPDGYHSITPYLIIDGAARALTFYSAAFGAVEIVRMPEPTSGKIGHAEMKIGNSIFMLADEGEMGGKGPQKYGGCPITLMIYTEDVDALVAQAVSSGAVIKRPIENQFYGDRSGSVEDPFGYTWHIATHIEDVSLEEMDKRMKEKLAQMKG
ncbi:MAG: VOC family protein [archaeon]